jgi:hypothetical protein
MRAYTTILFFILSIIVSVTQAAQEKDAGTTADSEVKALTGISIVGNKEAPKSLFIVPWKSSELGVKTSLSSQLLDEKLKVVDKEVFERELEFYYSINAE